jgi:hypothetical protein
MTPGCDGPPISGKRVFSFDSVEDSLLRVAACNVASVCVHARERNSGILSFGFAREELSHAPESPWVEG